MRIAIPVENGEIYQHFGHAPAFRVYDVENSKVIQVQEVPATGSGHAAMAGLLANLSGSRRRGTRPDYSRVSP